MGYDWFNLQLKQREYTDGSYLFQIIIDNEILYTVENIDPQEFDSVTAEFSSSESDDRWPASTGQFRNLQLKADGNPGKFLFYRQ